MRRLISDGAPSQNMYGTDIIPDFWALGLELFRDRATLNAKFQIDDIFDADSPLKKDEKDGLRGKADVIYLGTVLHLFGWEEQVRALAALAPVCKVGGEGMVLGCGVGWSPGREFSTEWENETKVMFYHDNETMREMWREVGARTGTKWTVKADLFRMERFLQVRGDWDWLGEGARMSVFEATRVE